MSVNLVKMCVGIDDIEQLRYWQAKRLKGAADKKLLHITRNRPKREEELLDGGSLYWVIKGYTAVRQPLIDIRPFVDKEGVGRCHLVYGKDLILVAPRPRRAFQGWRYLDAKDAPPDVGKAGKAMPDKLRRELAELGLL